MLKRRIKMMDTTSTLDQILDSRRTIPTTYDLGFSGNKGKSGIVFVKATRFDSASGSGPEVQSSKSKTMIRNMKHSLLKYKLYKHVCHYCRVRGHTRPECFYFYKDQRREKFTNKNITPFVKQVWVRKHDFVCHVSFHSTSTNREERWYFDSGCLQHMTGNPSYLTNIKKSKGEVTYGDRVKEQINGTSALNVSGLPKLIQVLLISGLHANLISVSQLCDQEWNVCFTKGRLQCHECQLAVCNGRSSTRDLEIWHQKLGHLNYRSLDKLVTIDGVRGLPNMKVEATSVWMFDDLCASLGITHEYSALKTLQQNGVVERKNRTIQEMARVLLNAKRLPQKFWAEAVNTACYTINRVYLLPGTHQTAYEIWKGKKPNIQHFHIFGSRCFILKDCHPTAKFEPKSDEGVFLGYSPNSRAYRVYNKTSKTILESINVVVENQHETIYDLPTSGTAPEPKTEVQQPSNANPIPESEPTSPPTLSPSNPESEPDQETDDLDAPTRIQKYHPTQNIIGDPSSGVRTRGRKRYYLELAGYSCYTSKIEPKNVKDALTDKH
ncbi:PREDICTED: uncharacterized protein LOC109153996 [Ipomoea nil]|uniref:uncharacterized protein LOC109153996 n=1 Tax=Ipomoea nil TaxID=35883 RepID=UPI00090103BA|nr:PREDICTED: uncharacterized protein LOC109153996 [Ipomoea nil]